MIYMRGEATVYYENHNEIKSMYNIILKHRSKSTHAEPIHNPIRYLIATRHRVCVYLCVITIKVDD